MDIKKFFSKESTIHTDINEEFYNGFDKKMEAIQEMASKAIREKTHQREIFQAILTSCDAAVIVAKIDCVSGFLVITHWMGAAEVMFGYSPQEAIGMRVDDIIPERYKKDHLHGTISLLKGDSEGTYIGKTRDTHGLTKARKEIRIRIKLSSFSLSGDDKRSFGAYITDLDKTADIVDFRLGD